MKGDVRSNQEITNPGLLLKTITLHTIQFPLHTILTQIVKLPKVVTHSNLEKNRYHLKALHIPPQDIIFAKESNQQI